jgi:hypothetical protein
MVDINGVGRLLITGRRLLIDQRDGGQRHRPGDLERFLGQVLDGLSTRK